MSPRLGACALLTGVRLGALLTATFFAAINGCEAPHPSASVPDAAVDAAADASPVVPPCTPMVDSGPMFVAPDGGHYDPPDPVPVQYQVLTNPYGYSDAGLADIGWPIYEQNCVRCHGADGHGDGSDATKYCPRPADLNLSNRLHPDQYLFWRIHDGGVLSDFHTAMPAYRGVLDDDSIWRVITTIRWRFIDF
jgi:hypothetical protein